MAFNPTLLFFEMVPFWARFYVNLSHKEKENILGWHFKINTSGNSSLTQCIVYLSAKNIYMNTKNK